MQAIEYVQYGAPEVLHLNEATKPSPKSNEVLVRVYATTVTAAEQKQAGKRTAGWNARCWTTPASRGAPRGRPTQRPRCHYTGQVTAGQAFLL